MRRFGTGPLSRLAARTYTLLVVEAALVATTAPGLALLVLLDRDASNVPLFLLCALPAGPALSAAVYALHRQPADLTDLRPAAAFGRGYRRNVGAALRIWVPLLAVLAVVAVSLTHREAAGVPVWWSALLVVVAAAVTLLGLAALVIVSLFEFRPVDVLRLAVHFVAGRPAVALGTAGLLLAAAAVTALTSEAVLLLLGSAFTAALLSVTRPMINGITERFVA
ncbi:hypothetical protein Daura_34605 [Dactylosporangium aurantiacum]|uniref:Uncharacterized protein n=1 Tax=Dactylosporangium aurantiacum TaxID=35754 RepID=A0A9Q9IQS7_9ACTN|nr:hypothetical protein [Dactylosporangium aurantiacum]MDG6107858.1 hypothetical protein [Dactylosporangium aurantiacum]UWZ59896.1 hypothetical protein Daura_34605 [Dactylosporangium aurantiacum]